MSGLVCICWCSVRCHAVFNLQHVLLEILVSDQIVQLIDVCVVAKGSVLLLIFTTKSEWFSSLHATDLSPNAEHHWYLMYMNMMQWQAAEA